MSIFAVNHLCREVLRDHIFRAAMQSAPAKALAPLDLTDDERSALLANRDFHIRREEVQRHDHRMIDGRVSQNGERSECGERRSRQQFVPWNAT